MPVSSEPNLGEGARAASYALVYWVETCRPITSPCLNKIPELLPSTQFVSSFASRLSPFETEVGNTGRIPRHLVGPSRL